MRLFRRRDHAKRGEVLAAQAFVSMYPEFETDGEGNLHRDGKPLTRVGYTVHGPFRTADLALDPDDEVFVNGKWRRVGDGIY